MHAEDAPRADTTRPLVPRPDVGRSYVARRSVRLSDADACGRLRLDAVARYLQDVASDDVADAGWHSEEHLWLIRRTEIHVLAPLLGDERVELTTWASGAGVSSAARRTTLSGDRGGLIEAESIWIHLDRQLRPARLQPRFMASYSASTLGRRVTPRLGLPDPPPNSPSLAWPLRVSDVDVLGHVNNAAYWEAIEQVLAGAESLRRPLETVLEFRRPIDLDDEVVVRFSARPGIVEIGFVAGEAVTAAAVLRVAL